VKGEATFWKSLAEGLNPGWQVDMRSGPHGLPDIQLSEIDNYVYAFDTGAGWLASGGMSSAEVQRAAAASNAAPLEIRSAAPNVAAQCISDAADAGSSFDSQLAREALSLTLVAITQTQTFVAAHETRAPGQRFHWVYVVYRMRDGSRVGRPACVGAQVQGLFDPEALPDLITRIVAIDTAPGSTSSVSQMLRRYGGAVLEKGLRRRVNEVHGVGRKG
jgi:hypothetical protein